MLERLFNAAWYGPWQWTWLLYPLAMLVGLITRSKRRQYLINPPEPFSVPVIVVGNLTIGGTGKTPVVQSLVKFLQEQGYKPGIISRGYGGNLTEYPHLISDQDTSQQVGDEPFMMYQALGVPIVVDPVRARGVQCVLKNDVNVVISDDGLQHYGLHRDIEVCVVDGSRGLGNGMLMPVGPLREDRERLNDVDFILQSQSDSQDEGFDVEPVAWVNVSSGEVLALDALTINPKAVAIAGIGNPAKFARTLDQIGVNCRCQWFPDHYDYKPEDLAGFSSQILMTEKDAVKIRGFATKDMWYLQIQARLPNTFLNSVRSRLEIWESENG